MIRFYDVTKVYPNGTEALKTVRFRVPEKKFTFLTGPSGSGKTTIIKIVLCIEAATSGSVIVGGRNLAAVRRPTVPYLRRNIGVIWQDFKLLDSRTVFDNVAIALEILGASRKEIQTRVTAMLERLGLLQYKNERPLSLSGGEQQRVSIARALVNRPTILLADEPTGNLDPERTFDIIRLLQEVNEQGTTVLVATHDPMILEAFDYPILSLRDGEVTTSPRPLAADLEEEP
ncbi:MAG: cell division ATP-binding protein FtsE [Myxococcales bacterium]|nr:cell division ATP-binding protein FtsE [Myxococcales bacterium]